MGLFDFFKKKEKNTYDPTNITLMDLQKGFVLEYDLKTWVVQEVYEYDWGDNYFSREYKMDSGDDTFFLHVEKDDELFLTITKKIKVTMIDEDLPEYLEEHEKAPKKIHYKNKTYYLDGNENPGYFKDLSDPKKDWVEFISWDYYDENDDEYIGIEQWGEREFEASAGQVVKEFEFSNILPGNE